MIVRFYPFAKDELFESAFHYESKRVGLGSEFRTEVMRGAQLLVEHPKPGRRVNENLFRLVLNRFPYSLYIFLRMRRYTLSRLLTIEKSRDFGRSALTPNGALQLTLDPVAAAAIAYAAPASSAAELCC